MGAILFAARCSAVNFTKAHYIKILLLVVPVGFYFGFALFANTFIDDALMDMILALNLDASTFNALSLILLCGYTILSLLYIDLMPVTRAEATFFFIAPIKDQTLLLYFLLKSLGVLTLVFFGLYYVNLFVIAPLFLFSTGQAFIMMGLQMLVLVFFTCFEFALFVLKYKNAAAFNAAKFLLIIGASVVLLMGFAAGYFAPRDLSSVITAVTAFFNDPVFFQIPVFRLVLTANRLVFGDGGLWAVGALLGAAAVLLFIAYSVKFSFAGSACDMAERYEKYRIRRQSGGLLEFSTKASVSKPLRGKGAKTLLAKELIEYGRTTRLFLTSQVLFFIGIMIFYAFLFGAAHQAGGSDGISSSMMVVLAGAVAFCLTAKPRDKALSLPVYRLLPIPIIKKLLVSSLMSNVENAICAAFATVYLLLMGEGVWGALLIGYIFLLLTTTSTFIDVLTNVLIQSDIFSLYRMLAGMILKMVLLSLLALLSFLVYHLTGSVAVLIAAVTFFAVAANAACLGLMTLRVGEDT